MEFKMSYKLGFDLNKVEDLKGKVLNFFGFSEKEVKNISINTDDDHWYSCTFEADEKLIKADNGTIKLDYINKKITINNKTLKIEENTDFAIKTLKTKIKIY